MYVLVACEESQRVATEFRNAGHIAFSCDIEPESGGHPEYHICQDVIPLLNGNCKFNTCDGKQHILSSNWDLIIAHPPCTYLTITGNRWFNEEKYGSKAIERKENRDKAIEFFMKFTQANCDRIAIENPIGVMSTIYRKPDQIIHPYQFGHPSRKSTCLWLKGLDKLHPTNIVEPELMVFPNGKTQDMWYYRALWLSPKERAKARSKTFPGIAKAMAEQWGNI